MADDVPLRIPEMVPAAKIAKRLGVTVRSLHKWAREGRFPKLRFYGRRWNVEQLAVQRWLENQPDDPIAKPGEHDERRAAADQAVPPRRPSGSVWRTP